MSTPSVALVQDALPFLGGAERVLESVLDLYPAAPLYTLVYNPAAFRDTPFAAREVRTSFIDRLPRASRSYRSYLPLFPLAVEQFDLDPFEIVLSFNYAAAHGVLVRPDQLHLSYTYIPLRQAWLEPHRFLRKNGFARGLKSWAARSLLHYLRLWDQAAARRVDQFIAPSRWVASVIWRVYRRTSQVIYPPVDVDRFCPLWPREDYYITVGRLVPHKKIDRIVEAFNRLDRPLLVVGEGPEREALADLAGPTVQLLGRQRDSALQGLLGRARAYVHMAEEDFGIAPVEAQAAGCPVIAFGQGGARETVIEGETGILFFEQSAGSLVAAVQEFERARLKFDIARLRENAMQYHRQRFQRGFSDLVEQAWEERRSKWNEPFPDGLRARTTPGPAD
jgi:glycosyltransferase involved in cell wall biosynthesis